MARYYDWSPAGYSTDPIPGDPQVLRDEAAKFKSVAESITEAATNLRNIANTGDASGEFVEEFATQANEVADRISKAEIKYTGLADALREYAGPLEQFQTDSVTILNRAINANVNAKDGAKWEQHWTKELLQPDLTPDQVEDVQKKLDAATRDRMDGESGAIFARRELEQLGFDRDDAASAAANKIKQAGEDSGINDTGWDNWVQFWEEHGDMIDSIVQVFGAIAAGLAVIALFIPGLNVIVATVIAVIAIVAMVAQVANAVAQASAGTKPISEAIVDIGLALIPFGAGKLAGAIGKMTVASSVRITAAARSTDAMADGVAGVLRSTHIPEVAADVSRVTPTLVQRLVSGNPAELAQLERLRDLATLQGRAPGAGEYLVNNSWILKDMPLVQGLAGVAEGAGFSIGNPIKEAASDLGWDKTIESEMSW